MPEDLPEGTEKAPLFDRLEKNDRVIIALLCHFYFTYFSKFIFLNSFYRLLGDCQLFQRIYSTYRLYLSFNSVPY